MQMLLHPFSGSIQRYTEEIAEVDRYRPDHCPQCESRYPLTGHGFYRRTLVDMAFDGFICVRRYLCRSCKRTAPALCSALAPLVAPPAATNFVSKALRMLESIGWMAAQVPHIAFA
jgi:hypothetical protein